ncbi:MAG: repeat-containing protein [Caulobacteraceae bacterium]|nr:repeat-containing protein [Caulobacteraceae bacterium]
MNGADLDALWARALDLHREERFGEAARAYGELLILAPDFVAARGARGLALKALGDFEGALADLDQVLARDPVHAAALPARAQALAALGRIDEAADAYRLIAEQSPLMAGDQIEIGRTLLSLERPGAALAPLTRAVELEPGNARARLHLGESLERLERFEESLAAYRTALELDPELLAAEFHIAMVLTDLQRPDESLEIYDRIVRLEPDAPEIHNNRGLALFLLGRFDEALEAYERSLSLRPDSPDTLYNRAYIRLAREDFTGGLRDMEWRKKLKPPLGFLDRPEPEWTGAEPLAGKTLFVHAEQGLGDSLQFCRYLLDPKLRDARLIFSCHPPLVRLMRSLGREVEIMPGTVPQRLDFHIPLLSLPLALDSRVETIPAPVPYLAVEPDRILCWRERIGEGGFRIGIVWGTSPKGRSIGKGFDPAQLAGIASLPGVRLISLQKGDDQGALTRLPPDMTIESLEPFDEGEDAFLDTAAILENLDLMISTDTSVAHLAAALGRPTWLALKYVPDWRWFLDRTDTPWYPDMRLFRQAALGDWSSVFEAMRTALAGRLADRADQAGPA